MEPVLSVRITHLIEHHYVQDQEIELRNGNVSLQTHHAQLYGYEVLNTSVCGWGVANAVIRYGTDDGSLQLALAKINLEERIRAAQRFHDFFNWLFASDEPPISLQGAPHGPGDY